MTLDTIAETSNKVGESVAATGSSTHRKSRRSSGGSPRATAAGLGVPHLKTEPGHVTGSRSARNGYQSTQPHAGNNTSSVRFVLLFEAKF